MRADKLAIAALALAVACGSPEAPVEPPPVSAVPANTVTSNVLRGDYAGSEVCGDCHDEIYTAWRGSPMRRMTRDTALSAVKAPFDGSVFHFKGDTLTTEMHGERKLMRLVTAEDGELLYEITRVIGGNYREDFVGVKISDPSDPSSRTVGEERVMPASWIYSTNSWRLKGYSVMVPERTSLRVAGPWRKRCVFCHNTVPYLSTVFDNLRGPDSAGYQGSVAEFFPDERTWSVTATDEDGLWTAVAGEMKFLNGATLDRSDMNLEELLDFAIDTTKRSFVPTDFVEMGIGCESCHNGAAQHVDDPDLLPSFAIRSDVLSYGPGRSARQNPTRSEWINRTCARCHTVLFSQYAYTWEGGKRGPSAGGSSMNSGEGRDFLLGGCSSQLDCAACHDPHAKDSAASRHLHETVAGNATCTECHTGYTETRALAGHTHHEPTGAGSVCANCHMPKKNVALDYELTRYHRIGSPNDPRRVEGDRPLECALCHTDKSVQFLVDAMQTWWGETFSKAALRRLYGDDLSVNAITATLERGKPHEQLAAVATLGDHGDPADARRAASQLVHDMPLVRYFALRAMEKLLGRSLDIDVNGSTAEIRAAGEAALAR